MAMQKMNVPQIIIIILMCITFICMIIDQYFPNYRNYVTGLWYFYIMRNQNNPLHYKLYFDLYKHLVILKKSGIRRYEQNLISFILKKAGNYKIKMTGKYKNKMRY